MHDTLIHTHGDDDESNAQRTAEENALNRQRRRKRKGTSSRPQPICGGEDVCRQLRETIERCNSCDQ